MSFFNHVLLMKQAIPKIYITAREISFLHFIMPLMLGLWQIERTFVLEKAAEALVG